MNEESLGWIFIDKIPLLYNEKNIERQLKIEKWLDLYQLTRELGIQSNKEIQNTPSGPLQNYVV